MNTEAKEGYVNMLNSRYILMIIFCIVLVLCLVGIIIIKHTIGMNKGMNAVIFIVIVTEMAFMSELFLLSL
jgi:hypothetical protein